jgi:hypothetical protein
MLVLCDSGYADVAEQQPTLQRLGSGLLRPYEVNTYQEGLSL